jgi:hypothetical protein
VDKQGDTVADSGRNFQGKRGTRVNDIGEGFPEEPSISEEMRARCRETGEYRPILFEWYKYVALLANLFARIRGDSLGLRAMPPVQYAVLVGLLNRCARLMFANVALSHEGLFGETTANLDRCVFESSVKLAWLCSQAVPDAFERFFAESLKTELELEREIRANIEKRQGVVQNIERRMLKSIDGAFASTGLTREQVEAAKKLPDLAAMLNALGQRRLAYVVGQRLGSHHVHGTWVSLRRHYLEQGEDGRLRPRDHDCETHVNQYLFVPQAVLASMRSFLEFTVADREVAAPFDALVHSAEDQIHRYGLELSGSDFDPAGPE